MEWIKTLMLVLLLLAIWIPLILEEIRTLRKSPRKIDYSTLIEMATLTMEVAETMFEEGADKKEWVLKRLESYAKVADWNIDLATVGRMIDQLADMSKKVNAANTTS